MTEEQAIRKQLTTKELSEKSGLTTARIRQLLIEGRDLVGYKVGRDWVVTSKEAERWLNTLKR